MKIFMMMVILLNSATLLADEEIKLSSAQLYNLGVKLGKLKAIRSAPLLDAPAKVMIPPDNEYIVSTAHAGLVSRVKATIGDEVEQGQVLAIIKSPELLAIQQHHLKSINDLKLAKADFSRDEKLYNEGVIADRRWLQTKTNYNVFQSHVHETRQLLEISGVSRAAVRTLEKTHKLTSQLEIRAPISGIILDRMVTVGERADAMAPLFRVANFKKLWLEISVPQQRIQHVRVGDKVMIPGTKVTASIFLLGKHVDEKNQTVLARAEIETSQNSVRPGQTVSVKINQSSSTPMYRVPNSALAQHEEVTYLFIRTTTGFAARPVQVVGREAKKTTVSGGLQGVNEIAIRGAVALKANFLGLGADE